MNKRQAKLIAISRVLQEILSETHDNLAANIDNKPMTHDVARWPEMVLMAIEQVEIDYEEADPV